MQEKRQAPRIETNLKFISCSSGLNTDSRITNMSSTGAFIETCKPLPDGTSWTCSFKCPMMMKSCPLNARVVWIKSNGNSASAGMGVQFIKILPKHQEKLNAFIEENQEPDISNGQAIVYV